MQCHDFSLGSFLCSCYANTCPHPSHSVSCQCSCGPPWTFVLPTITPCRPEAKCFVSFQVTYIGCLLGLRSTPEIRHRHYLSLILESILIMDTTAQRALFGNGHDKLLRQNEAHPLQLPYRSALTLVQRSAPLCDGEAHAFSHVFDYQLVSADRTYCVQP